MGLALQLRRFGRGLASVALMLVLAGCENPLESTTLPATFLMSPGDVAHAKQATLTFIGVTSDSRCPIDVVCIQAGDVIAAFTVSAAGLDGRYELQLLNPAKKSVVHRGYTIELMDVRPLPVSGQGTPPTAYRATVKVR